MMMQRFLPLGIVLAFCLGCEAPPTESVESKPETIANAPRHSPQHEKAAGCADDHGMAATDDSLRKAKDPASGTEMTIVGSALSGLEKTAIPELLGKPETYAGKTIRLEGDVNAMCHHRRGWFAMQEPGDRTGAFVRVITNPAFLVPPGSIGKKVRVEGKVDLIEESASAARHYAEGHQIGDPSAIQGPVKRVVLRASGAEFL
ncbi:MAG TPA: DUF4920 domain-containing protein [Polyangiaceae bacterium]|jgi:hypothetical protein|nr:DUF4920 domain-containing protein [Polyangiaceae bacterium]